MSKDRILQRLAAGSSTTTEISSATAHKNADIDPEIDAEIDAENEADIDAKHPVLEAITVSTSYDVSTEEVTHNLDYRVTSTFDPDGFFVRLARNLEQRLNPSVSASYMRLVTTCGRGDNESVKRQLQ